MITTKFPKSVGTVCRYVTYMSFAFIVTKPNLYAKSHLITINFQQEVYQGKVTDKSGEALAGATVRVKGTNELAVTNASGNFRIKAQVGQVLEVSYTGYLSQNITLSSSNSLSVVLQSNDTEIDEVVIVGYNSLRETNISGAISKVDMAVADKRRVQDVSQMLQGVTAGVNVTQSTGQPGDAIDIRIRGVGTIGNNSPLYIVDGIPTTNSSFINPADIESMSVLKDASAASIYGSRAAAGVILITTKKGKSGITSFNVNVFSGTQRAVDLPQMMNTTQYLNTLEKAWANSNSSGINPYIAEKKRTDLANTNWLDEIFETGKTKSYQISASGGSEKVTYMFSSGLYNQDGIVIYDNDKYKRLELRSNINAKLTDRIELNSNILLNHQDKMVVSSRGDVPGLIRHALLRPPVLSVYKDLNDPTYSIEKPFTDLPFYVNSKNFQSKLYEWSQNPVAIANYSNNNQEQFKLLGSLSGQISFLQDKSLKLKSTVGLELNFNHSKVFLANYGDDDGSGSAIDAGMGRINRPNGLNEDRGQDYTLTWNNVLNYDKKINDHQINALVGSEFIVNESSAINASRRRFEYESDRFQYLDLGGSSQDLWNGGYDQEWALFSLFTSMTYSYKSKYSVTANLRGDASTRFGEDNKWGYFPSISAGWTVSNEPFFNNNEIFTYMKLRASTGKLGNQNITNYAYLTLFSREGNITRYGNPSLKWESTLQNDFGMDLRFFRNKLEVNADIFHKKTKDILLAVSLPTFVGNVDATYVNAGQVENKGFELSARFRDKIGSDFSYGFGGNLTSIDNKVAALHENVPRIIGAVSRAEVGQPLDVYYGYVMEGIYQNQNEITTHLHGVSIPLSKPGDIKFKDLNGDGVINDSDRTFIGNPIPKYSYGFHGNIDYKGFDLNVLFQGISNVDRFNDGMAIIDFDSRPFNYTTKMLGAWDGEGSTNSLPRVAFEDTGVSRFSTLYIEDASYMRLKNIELGYSFGKYLNKYGIKNARLYVSGQNLYTWTNYTGLDPESTDVIDRGTYPQARTFLVGLNFNF